MSNSSTQRGYCISFKTPGSSPGMKIRDAGEEGNPLSSLHFEPGWDSDELYDALRVAFPRIENHKDRFLRAVIEFYDAELGRARNKRSLGANEGLDTPPSSPPSLARQRSESSETAELREMRERSEDEEKFTKGVVKAPEMQSMQATFSIVPGLKPRTKRPMTEEERKQYRHTKKVGACEPCRRRKRKCVCRLPEEAEGPASKKARVSTQIATVNSRVHLFNEEVASTKEAVEASSQQEHGTMTNLDVSYDPEDEIIEDTEDQMAVTRVTKSMSLSPISLALDPKFDWSSISLCPELNLGDLAMPDVPALDLGSSTTPLDFDMEKPSGLSSLPNSRELSPKFFSQCDDFVNFTNITSPSPIQNNITRQHTLPLGYPDTDFTTSIHLISKATTALAPFSPFATDAQLLLGDLRSLKLQLQLLRKPLPFLSKSSQYYNTVREVALDMCEPLRTFLERLEKMCGVEDLEGQKLGLAYTNTTFQLKKLEWVRGVKDDARKLRSMIGARSSTISSLMTLVSMETLTELHNLLHPIGNDLTSNIGLVGNFLKTNGY